MATTSTGVTAPSTSGSANAQTLAEWAGPYVTNMMGQANAIANQPYQVYQGPLTAGESSLQNKVFSGLGDVKFPTNLGQSFSSASAPNIPNISGGIGSFNTTGTPTGGTTPTALGAPAQPNIATQYMNPYLQSVLEPQLQALRRQNDITQMKTNADFTNQGAFGGGRNAIMNAQNNADLMRTMNTTVGQGYSNAFDKAQQQFNTEQGQAKTLVDMLNQAGGTQRDIEQQGVTADLNEFNQQRDYPQKQVQFLQSMLQGLPLSTVYNVPQAQTGAQQAAGSLNDTLTLLGKLGIKI